MQSEKERITELERKLAELERWAEQFQNVSQVDSQIARTIKIIAGNATLTGLSDVSITTPSNGQVLEYLNGVWINATDNT